MQKKLLIFSLLILCHFYTIAQLRSSKKDQFDNENIFIQAIQDYINKDYTQALEKLEECEKKLNASDLIHFKKAEIYLAQKKYQQGLESINKAIKKKERIYYYELKLKLLFFTSSLNDIPKVYQKLLSMDAGEDHYINYASFLMDNIRYTEAIKVLNKFEERFGLNEFIIKKKQENFIAMGKLKNALEEGEKLVKAFPNNKQYPLSQITLLLKNEKLEEALDRINKEKKNYPNEPLLHIYEADVYLEKNKLEQYLNSLKKALYDRNLDIKIKINYLLDFAGKKEELFEILSHIEKLHSEDRLFLSFYGDILFQYEEYEKSRYYYQKAIEKNNTSLEVWKILLQLDAKFADYQALSKHSMQAIEIFPNQFFFYLYGGSTLIKLEKYQKAKEILEKGLPLASIDNSILLQFYHLLATTYHELKEYKKCDKVFEDILHINGNDTMALNNYSYYLALRKEKLEKAKEMGELLLNLAPQNTSYIDTYGWVLYKMGDYKKARQYLEKAAERTRNGKIIEHFGDVLYQLGEKDLAIIQWEKAKKNSKTPELLEKKIKNLIKE